MPELTDEQPWFGEPFVAVGEMRTCNGTVVSGGAIVHERGFCPVHVNAAEAQRLRAEVARLTTEKASLTAQRDSFEASLEQMDAECNCAEAEARGYQRAIDAMRARVKVVADQSERDGVDVSDLVEAVQIAADYLEASAQTAIRSGENDHA